MVVNRWACVVASPSVQVRAPARLFNRPVGITKAPSSTKAPGGRRPDYRDVEMGLGVKVGTDAGPVLLFANHRGPSVSARAAALMLDIEGGVSFTARVSRVEVNGIRV